MVEEIRWLLPHIGVTVLTRNKRPKVLLTTASASLCKYQQSKQGKKKKVSIMMKGILTSQTL